MNTDPLELAHLAASIADDCKAEDIEQISLASISDVADYFVICTASNKPLRDHVVEEIESGIKKKLGIAPVQVEGRSQDGWILMDYGSVVVHVFLPEARDYYRLERLWSEFMEEPIEQKEV